MSDDRSLPKTFLEHYWRGLGLSARNNSLAYGFSVAITGGYGLLSVLAPPTTVPRIFLFGVGACVPFLLLNPLVTRGFQKRVEREPPLVVAVGTSFSILSASAALGAAALLGWLLDGWAAWLFGALGATVVYLLAGALEIAVARSVRPLTGAPPPDEE
jgi:hypothetical protein